MVFGVMVRHSLTGPRSGVSPFPATAKPSQTPVNCLRTAAMSSWAAVGPTTTAQQQANAPSPSQHASHDGFLGIRSRIPRQPARNNFPTRACHVIRIRRMTAADLSLGMRLKAANGWNQTEADWRRYLDLGGEGCVVAELDGEPVGTTATCVVGTVAWIAMVLVDAEVRGRGIGKALMSHALEHLDRRGIACLRLDATPLGQPLYEKLGFQAEF